VPHISRLSIPKSDFPTLIDVLNLNESDFRKLLEAIREATSALSRLQLETQLAPSLEAPRHKLQDILRLFITLYRVQWEANMSTQRFVDAVIEAIQRNPEQSLASVGDKWDTYRHRLQALMQFDEPLGIIAKVAELTSASAQTLHDARIITDIRPVFKSDPSEAPAAALILHDLVITYHDDDRLKTFHVTLEDNDIQILRTLLDRAEAKGKTLRSMLVGAQVAVVEESLS